MTNNAIVLESGSWLIAVYSTGRSCHHRMYNLKEAGWLISVIVRKLLRLAYTHTEATTTTKWGQSQLNKK